MTVTLCTTRTAKSKMYAVTYVLMSQNLCDGPTEQGLVGFKSGPAATFRESPAVLKPVTDHSSSPVDPSISTGALQLLHNKTSSDDELLKSYTLPVHAADRLSTNSCHSF